MKKLPNKKVPLTEEQEFVKLDARLKTTDKKLSELKETFRTYYKKGMKFTLLTPKPSERRNIPWDQLVDELLDSFATPSYKKRFHKKVLKRFPAVPIATAFLVKKDEDENEK